MGTPQSRPLRPAAVPAPASPAFEDSHHEATFLQTVGAPLPNQMAQPDSPTQHRECILGLKSAQLTSASNVNEQVRPNRSACGPMPSQYEMEIELRNATVGLDSRRGDYAIRRAAIERRVRERYLEAMESYNRCVRGW